MPALRSRKVTARRCHQQPPSSREPCSSRVVKIPADGDAEGLAFPIARAADELDYTFDFAWWLGPLDRVANASVVPSPDMPTGGVTVDHGQVVVRLGPAPATGTYFV